MSPRNQQPPLAAAYQLMANYLVWDLRDLLSTGELSDPNASRRLNEFVEMLTAAGRAAKPAHPSGKAKPPRQGSARAEQTKRLESLSRDQELLNLVLVAHGDDDESAAANWATRAAGVLQSFETGNWEETSEPEGREFIESEVESFLQRLQRIDQDDAFRPTKRTRLSRR
jgi:hypothetical protein